MVKPKGNQSGASIGSIRRERESCEDLFWFVQGEDPFVEDGTAWEKKTCNDWGGATQEVADDGESPPQSIYPPDCLLVPMLQQEAHCFFHTQCQTTAEVTNRSRDNDVATRNGLQHERAAVVAGKILR